MKKDYLLPENRKSLSWEDRNQAKTIYDLVNSYAESGIYPLHMPGHKRNTDLLGTALPYRLDMTESKGMVDLHDPSGLLQKKQEALAKRYGAGQAFYMVNGSTGGILAGLRTLTRPGDEVIFSRNAHQSAYHGLEIFQLKPHYILPDWDPDYGVLTSISPDKIEEALQAHPACKLVYITSPSYDGFISDIRTIAKTCHQHGALLMVDEAHGAHLPYAPSLGGSAISLGADLVVQSLHKTLPALTSTALCLASDQVDPVALARNLAIFETSSPSHLLLASIDECLTFMESRGREDLEALLAWIAGPFKEKIQDLAKLQVFTGVGPGPHFFRHDPTKLVISSRRTPWSGTDLKEALYKQGFELEMAYGDYALAILTLADRRDKLEEFADLLVNLDRKLECKHDLDPAFPPKIPNQAMDISFAMAQPSLPLPRQEALGRVSRDYLWAYPPGIPIVLPGEVFDQASLNRLTQLEESGVTIKSSSKLDQGQVLVLPAN